MCHHTSNEHTALEFSRRGEEIVIALLEDLGMDSETTTAQQMDDLDLRFLCGDCHMKYTVLAELPTATEKARRDAPAIAVCEV
jgi:hypothetical protein